MESWSRNTTSRLFGKNFDNNLTYRKTSASDIYYLARRFSQEYHFLDNVPPIMIRRKYDSNRTVLINQRFHFSLFYN